jgi:hypothetical protein
MVSTHYAVQNYKCAECLYLPLAFRGPLLLLVPSFLLLTWDSLPHGCPLGLPWDRRELLGN